MDKKKKVGVIFGGMSTENEVSVQSAKSIMNNIDKNTYEIYPIYIDKKGVWYESKQENEVSFGEEIKDKVQIDNIIKYLKKLDIVFPVLHGLYGEDGTIQGLLKLLNIKFVGCGVLASSVGMDKAYTKIIFDRANINQAKYAYLKVVNEKYVYVDENFNEKTVNMDEAIKLITDKIKFPMFVKPSNSGSSVGIKKAENKEELEENIRYSAKFDTKVLIEEEIQGKEVECAVLGNEEVIASNVGEIKPADEFYSFDAKYKNSESRTVIPADIPEAISEEIRKLAIKAFKAIDGRGLSRVDFFVEKGSNKVYINEINTLPGFTNISMYPKLFENVGIKYDELLDTLLKLAEE